MDFFIMENKNCHVIIYISQQKITGLVISMFLFTWQGPVVPVQMKTIIGLGVKVVTIIVKLGTAAHADGVASTSLKFYKSFVYI